MIVTTKASIKKDPHGWLIPLEVVVDIDDIASKVYGEFAGIGNIEEIRIQMPKGCFMYGIPVRWGTES